MMIVLLLACRADHAEPCEAPLTESSEVAAAIDEGGTWGVAAGDYSLDVHSRSDVALSGCGDVTFTGTDSVTWTVEGGSVALDGITVVAGDEAAFLVKDGTLLDVEGGVLASEVGSFGVVVHGGHVLLEATEIDADDVGAVLEGGSLTATDVEMSGTWIARGGTLRLERGSTLPSQTYALYAYGDSVGRVVLADHRFGGEAHVSGFELDAVGTTFTGPGIGLDLNDAVGLVSDSLFHDADIGVALSGSDVALEDNAFEDVGTPVVD